MKAIPFNYAALLLAGLVIAASAGERKIVDAQTAKAITSGHTWQTRHPVESGYWYWTWKSEGSACMRLFSHTGKCTDTGTWKLHGARLCYELTFWRPTGAQESGCFRIADVGNGQYQGVQDNGLDYFPYPISVLE